MSVYLRCAQAPRRAAPPRLRSNREGLPRLGPPLGCDLLLAEPARKLSGVCRGCDGNERLIVESLMQGGMQGEQPPQLLPSAQPSPAGGLLAAVPVPGTGCEGSDG